MGFCKMNDIDHITIVEWFSGIGGMRFAFEALIKNMPFNAPFPKYSFVSFDVNVLANNVYSSSFPGDVPSTQSIETLPLAEIEALNGAIWLLSPPCQPFTLGGTQLDEKDCRSRALLHIISILEQMSQPPEYILLENVPRFENSNCKSLFLSVLSKRNYFFEEYLIAPTDPVIEIPNARLRYYLLAKRDMTENCSTNIVITSLESIGYSPGQFSDRKTISEYIIAAQSSEEKLLVPCSILCRGKGFRFDVISPSGVPLGHRAAASGIPACSTFTKGYGSNRIRGTGSLLLLKEPLSTDTSDVNMLVSAGVRYFSPKEIALLHAFPFEGTYALRFPSSMSLIQKYRLLGNSLNVRVVTILLSRLLSMPLDLHL